MTTANKITLGRILLVPFFIGLVIGYKRTGQDGYRLGGLLVFGLASAGDGLDGYVARHFNQRSKLGAILDPLADKLLLTAAVILLTLPNHVRLARIPLWLTVTMLGRDLIILLGMAAIQFTAGRVRVRARWAGKIATVLQIALVVWILLRWNAQAARFLVAGVGCFTILSALIYIRDGLRQRPGAEASL